MYSRILLVSLLLLTSLSFGRAKPEFDGIDRWKVSLAAAEPDALKGLYSTTPPARFVGADQKSVPDISPEIVFWQKLITAGISKVEVNTLGEQDQKGLHLVRLAITLTIKTPDGPRTRYVMEQQGWDKQGEGWRIVVAAHSGLLKMRPALKPNPALYNKDADAKLEIKEAVALAAKNHQRVILVFGGNWCYDCHVLDQAFHQADVAPLVEKNFQVVHVDIGEDGKKNNNLAAAYDTPLDKGVPALAILDPDGKLVYSQKNGEWESARSLDPDDVIIFLNKWKP